jgi:isoquinoline 1-oxidoreductase subunit beta
MYPKVITHLAAPASAPIATSRRGFLLGVTAVAGGFLLGFRPAHAQDLPSFVTAPPADQPVTPYLRLNADNTVTAISAQFDMGQGIYAGIATLVAEELDADYAQMRVEGGSGEAYGNLNFGGAFQLTGGSTGMVSSYLRYRQAGAAARAMLVAAAAARWGVDPAAVTVAKGVVTSGDNQATFGDLATEAAAQPLPSEVTLKDRADWAMIGNADHRRLDSVEKGNGTQVYTIDVRLPGMAFAVPIHPPLFGATLRSFDATAAKAVAGVIDVVEHPRGLAVVAENTWAAIQARDLVIAEWDDSAAEKRSTADLETLYRAALDGVPQMSVRNDGDTAAAFTDAAQVVEADFAFPYLAHAALEPINAAARINDDGTVEVWGGHQAPLWHQMAAAGVAGTTPDKVILHIMKTGGGFGRRATFDGDIVIEAVAVAKAVGRPVLMQWTRADDMRAGRYRPAFMHRMRAALDAEGNLTGWENHIVGQSIMAGTAFDTPGQPDVTSVEGANNLPYAIPNMKIDLTTMQTGVPVLWWRAVGSTHTAYAVETFMDEVATAAGQDPVAFRLSMLDGHPRHAAVLREAADKAGWSTPLPEGRFRGVALAESFNTIVAQVAEISVTDGLMKVERVVCALDCGIAVMPDQVKAQMEGGIGFGLGAILKSRITLDGGQVVEENFDGYEVLRIDEMPQVEVHILDTGTYPTGVGEPGVPPIGPAVANAWFSATGKRVRVLPFNDARNA